MEAGKCTTITQQYTVVITSLMSWGDVWLTVGQASIRQSLIKRLINGTLGWGHKLGPEVHFEHFIQYFIIALHFGR